EQHLLRGSDPLQRPPGHQRRHERQQRDDARRNRDCRTHCGAHCVGSVKMTGYSELLFETLCSFGTGATFTLTEVDCEPKKDGSSWTFRKVTAFCSLGLIRSITCVFTIGVVPPVIVSVTGMCTSTESPESSTVTAKPRLVPATTGRREVVDSSVPLGSALVETMFVPCRPPAVGETLTPRSRVTTAARPCAV